MKSIYVFMLCVTVFLASFGVVFSEPVQVIAVGRVLCHGQPLKHSKVSLMDKDGLRSEFMGEDITDETGKFQIFGSGEDSGSGDASKPDVFVRFDYVHVSEKAEFEVDRAGIRGGKEKTPEIRDQSYVVDFGTIRLYSEMCGLYQRFYEATHDFYRRVGYKVPFALKIVAEAVLQLGTPYASYDSIRIPRGEALSSRTAKHELAHTIRHKYDGSRAHFLRDVVRYGYARNHNCMSETNFGFAFNEGWAEYWAGDTSCGDANGNMKIEGNVATALKHLQDTCRTSDHNMWKVLRINPGSIHNYSVFETKHKNLYGCPQ